MVTFLDIVSFVIFPPMDFFVFQHFSKYYQDKEKKTFWVDDIILFGGCCWMPDRLSKWPFFNLGWEKLTLSVSFKSSLKYVTR